MKFSSSYAAGVVSKLGRRHSPLYRAARAAERRACVDFIFAAVVAMLTVCASAAVTITKNSNTNWTVNNGLITMVFDPNADDVTTVQLGSGAGALTALCRIARLSSTRSFQCEGSQVIANDWLI